MKRTHKGPSRLLSAGLSLALLATLLPSAAAATVSGRIDRVNTMSSSDTLEISVGAFDDYCDDQTGAWMDEITITTVPSSREGTLSYTDADTDREVTISSRTTLAYSQFDELIFEPETDYDGTVYIDFTGYATNDERFTGTIEIDVNGTSAADADDITYTVARNRTVTLDADDFDDACNDVTRDNLYGVRFTSLPASSRGALYLDYNTSSEDDVLEDEWYRTSELDYITFVPNSYTGTVTIPYDGEAEDGTRFTGELVITVSNSGSGTAETGDVTLYTDVNEDVYLEMDDFDDFVYDETSGGDEATYLWFTSLPSSREGTLYYEGTSSDETVTVNREFPHREIDYLFFVPYDDFEGSVTIPFAGEADSGETFRGDLVINVGVTAEAEVTVELQGATGSPLAFQAADFNDASVDATGSNLNYVVFDYTSGRGGYLYYQYGETSQDEVASARYYRSASPSLSEVSFVPSSATGSSVTIPFTGYATNGESFRGEVVITFITLQSPSVVGYTSNGQAVRFRASDFSAACADRGGSNLVSVQFTVPDSTGGQLYYDFTSPSDYRGEVLSSVTYSVSGMYMLDLVSFLPRAEYSGIVTIPYVGTDAAGITFNGSVQIMVTSPTTTTRFNDMGSYSWAVPGVEFLAAYGITTGTGSGATYSPADPMTRGDYVLMLVRSFGLTATATDSFGDVPADSYYASALATAKALGIIEADSSGNFRPTDPVTREDSMLFLYRAMQQAGRTVPSAYDSYLSRYPDGSSVSAYARSAMAAMAQAGIIKGDQASRLNPQGTLTRAEMAVILHRGLTL